MNAGECVPPGVIIAVAAAAFLMLDRARVRHLRIRERLFEARERQMRDITRDVIGASRESAATVCRTLDQAVRALCPAIDAVLFAHRDAETLHLRYASGQRGEYFRGARLSLERDTCALTRAALYGHRIAARGVQRPALAGDRAFLAVPMLAGGTTIGVFYVSSASVDSFDTEESIVTAIDLAAWAYQLARDREIDRERATIDDLTKLLTPRAFRARLFDAVARRTEHPASRLALLFIDTDNFKPCNDTLGHQAGDAVLRTLAQVLTANSGPDSLVGRNGGDEFCILLAGTTKTQAIARAEQIRRAVESHAFEALLSGKTLAYPITTSIGIAAFPADAKTAEMLLERADDAMYHSKKNGRNRVSFYNASGTLVRLDAEPRT